MEEQSSAPEAPPTAAPSKGKGMWIGLIVVVIVIVILLGAVFGGLLGPSGPKPQAVFFVGYPGQGDKLIPTWWSNRAQWPAEWLYSEGLKVDDFFGRLKTAGVDVTKIEGTAPAAPVDANYTASAALFNAAYQAAYGTAPNVYDPNSYDALFTLAMAFQKAQTTDTNSTAFKAALRAVANPPGIAIRPGEWAKAKANITAGNDVDYQGASGAVNYDQFGEVASDYEAWQVNSSGNATRKLFIPEGSWTRSAPAPPGTRADDTPQPLQNELKIGTLFDRTGPLKDFGWDMENATDLAAAHITSGGGITINSVNMPLMLIHEDDGTDAVRTANAARKLVNVDQVKAVIGATASSASAAAFAVIAPAGLIEVTASSTSPVFTTSDTTDQFWRTAPSDALQGAAAGWYAYVNRGWRTMSVLYVDNAYGRGLSTVFKADFTARGGTILRMVAFAENPVNVDANSVLQTLFTPGAQPAPQPIAPTRRTER